MNIHYTTVKGRRDENEDNHNIILNIDGKNKELAPINYFGIYDGHGGSYVSDFLKKNMPSYYCNKKINYPITKKYHDDVFSYVQKEILKNPKGYTNGSTCLLAIIYRYNNELFLNVANIGDSRLIGISKDGITKQITEDHKPDSVKEIKRIQKLGGEIHVDEDGTTRIGDLSVSKSFGDEDNAPYISQEPDIYNVKLENMKYLILTCDGLIESLNNEDILPVIKKSKKKNLAVCLAEDALKKGTGDNVSIIVIEFD